MSVKDVLFVFDVWMIVMKIVVLLCECVVRVVVLVNLMFEEIEVFISFF